MKTFFKLLSLSVQGKIYYRTSFFINLLSPIVTLIGQFILWSALYGEERGSIGTMARADMFSYILIAFALNNLLSWSAENKLSKEIRSGTVVARCVRPAPFLVQYVSETMGALAVNLITNLAIVIIGFIFFGKFLVVPSLYSLVKFVPCFILAILLRIMFIDVFSLLCFFTTGHLGIAWTRTALTEFFSGALIPVSLFPLALRTLSYFTPFPYMLQIPIAVLLGQELPVNLWTAFAVQSGWIGIFLLLHCLIYGSVRRNMSIAGG